MPIQSLISVGDVPEGLHYIAGVAQHREVSQMFNPDHVSWIKEGVDEWNSRRSTASFVPDFSGNPNGLPLLQGVNLHGADLRGAKFTGSPQIGVDFRDSDLTDADFTGAVLAGARFHRANLTNANFVQADLGRFDSSMPNGVRAQIDPADLTDAVLVGTDLSTANLAGVNLGGSKPWQSKMFPKPTVLERYDLVRTEVHTISDLMEIIGSLKHHYDDDYPPDHRVLFFRGESKWRDSNGDWVLSPAVMRDEFGDFESLMLVDLIGSNPLEFVEATSALSKWTLAQHHLLRTRFLDVTKNPLVGLFFACEKEVDHAGKLHVFAAPRSMVKSFNSDAVSVIANLARLSRSDQDVLLGKVVMSSVARHDNYTAVMGKLYQLIEEEKPGFEKRIDPRDFYRVFVIEPQLSSARVRAQSGAMLASAFHKRFEREVLEGMANIDVYGHYVINIPPGETKSRLMEDLRILQITRPNLFPGLDETSTEITQRYSFRHR